jgi:saccharopine dehydrogenase-like NADP-dependent oxidoreductase
VYPNRDSFPYIDTYGIAGVRTMFRATLRKPGWCATMKKIAELGFLSDAPIERAARAPTWAAFTARLAGVEPAGDARAAGEARLALAPGSDVAARLEWLGLFSADPLPDGPDTPLDLLCARMLDKMRYGPGERDMIVLFHDFAYEDAAGAERRATSTLVDYGVRDGDSSMSRTVSLPAAIATRLVLEGKVALRGVHVPVRAELYEPILDELGSLGIRCEERDL